MRFLKKEKTQKDLFNEQFLTDQITSADLRNHLLRYHRPSCLPKHERLRLHPALSSLGNIITAVSLQ